MHPSRRFSSKGVLTCVAMFVLGGLVVTGLFLSPRGGAPRAPNVPAGVPNRALRFIVYDVFHNAHDVKTAAAEIRSIDPDYVLLDGVELDLVAPLAEALGMRESYHSQLFQRPKDIDPNKGWQGVCILSRHPLFEGRALISGDRRTFGVTAVSVVDGKKFAVACFHLSVAPEVSASQRAVLATMCSAGEMPAVMGGAHGGQASSTSNVSMNLRRAKTLPQMSPAALSLSASGSWAVRSAGTIGSPDNAFDACWLEAGGSPVTQPTSRR